MAVPSLKSLMAEMDLDTHAGRVRRLALLGRDESGNPKLATLLDELTSRGTYWHRLAQQAAIAASDSDRLVEDLSSQSASIRWFAYRHLVAAGSKVDELIHVYPTLSTVERKGISHLVSRSGDQALCERLVAVCRDSGRDDEAARLLSGCSAAVVAELLPQLDHLMSGWAALGHRHPTVFLAYLEKQLTEAPRSRRDSIWRTAAAAVQTSAPAEPERVIGLMETLGPRFGPASVLGDQLGRMFRAFPSRMTVMMLRPELVATLVRQGVPRAVLANARVLSAEDQLAWVRALREAPNRVAEFLKRLAPAARPEVFAGAFEGVDTSAIIWPEMLLEALPHDVRTVEVRRMLAVRHIAEDPVRVLAVTSFLPIREARPTLEDATRAAQAEDRAAAYGLLVACTRRSRSTAELGLTLETLRRLRNEQDPVRLGAIGALVAVPGHLFDDSHLPDLLGLVAFVVEARDTSAATVNHLRSIILGILVDLPGDATGPRLSTLLQGLDRLAGPSGTMSFGQIGHRLRHDAEKHLLAALVERLREDAKRDRYDLTLSLAAGLGRRAWDLEELQRLLQLATRAPLDTTVRRAIELWLAPPRTRSDRVGHLVGHDPSTLTLGTVLNAVSARRQDLLDVLLRTKPLKGRFLTGNVRHVPVILNGLGRWLPRQHEAYADALLQLIKDSASKPWVRASAIRALARIPGIGATQIEPFLDHPAVDVVEAALAGLSWSDEPDRQLTRLLGYADGDRARVAIYAATRCARFCRPDALGDALVALLASRDAKITSRKEAIRLLAQHKTPNALAHLLRVGREDEAHRDVRIAVGRSLRHFLDDPRTWTFLATQTAGTPDEARSLLETSPWHIAVRHRTQFGRLVAELTKYPDQRVKTLAFGSLSSWSPWLPASAEISVEAVLDLESGPAWQPAVRCLGSIFADGLGAGATVSLIQQLAARDDGPERDGAAQRDRPSRQRLVAIVTAITSLDVVSRETVRADLNRCADSLTQHSTCILLEAALRLAAADLLMLDEPLQQIRARLDGRSFAAARVGALLAGVLQRDRASWSPEDLQEPTERLLTSRSMAGDFLALQLVNGAGPRSGWSADWRELLRQLRRSEHSEIALAALEVFTAAEAS